MSDVSGATSASYMRRTEWFNETDMKYCVFGFIAVCEMNINIQPFDLTDAAMAVRSFFWAVDDYITILYVHVLLFAIDTI